MGHLSPPTFSLWSGSPGIFGLLGLHGGFSWTSQMRSRQFGQEVGAGGGHTSWARMLSTPCATDGAGGHWLCPGGQVPGWHCCLSDLLFLCRILCLLPTMWKLKETKEQSQYPVNITKVEMSEKYREEKKSRTIPRLPLLRRQ